MTKQPKKRQQKCLCCENPASVRGLCSRCYRAAVRVVRSLSATWEQLIAEGLALGTQQGARRDIPKRGFAAKLRKIQSRKN